MSLRLTPVDPVPEQTARIARTAFPNGNVYMQMRDVLGVVYDDASFASLFATRGRPAEAPWRLALVTVMQFMEGLSDRQAAEAVRARIDWKYALGLELTDSGFDFSVLCEFRSRLVDGSAEHLLLDVLLAACKARGYLKARGRQRTDSTHVLGALRILSRLECVAETFRQALNAIATLAPEWLRTHAPPDWFERYGRRIEEYRLPKGQDARLAYAELVGADGMCLLDDLWAPGAPPVLRELPEVEILRQTWIYQYAVVDEQSRLRDPKDMPPTAERMDTPYEPEARYGSKRGFSWIGYKIHLTETCDDDLPHLLTHVATTIATASDLEQLAPIQQGLGKMELLPAQQFADAGYVRARNLVTSQSKYQIDLVGPIYEDRQWQAKASEGFAVAHFAVDWDAHRAICPEGKTSARWGQTDTARRRTMVHIDFSAADCAPCTSRPRCTRAKVGFRSLLLQSREEYEALRTARQRQEAPDFAVLYARRSGIEGTVSQGVRAFGLRRARYRGLAKTHLQHVACGSAINVMRLANWLNGIPLAKTRCSRFAALAKAS